MRTSAVIGGLLVALALAVPASACEKCAEYWDYQANRWCKYCAPSDCGYYGCTVEHDRMFNMDICGSRWDAPGSDECFTSRGEKTGGCGPGDGTQPFDQEFALTTPEQWHLVRARIERPSSRRRNSTPRG